MSVKFLDVNVWFAYFSFEAEVTKLAVPSGLYPSDNFDIKAVESLKSFKLKLKSDIVVIPHPSAQHRSELV